MDDIKTVVDLSAGGFNTMNFDIDDQQLILNGKNVIGGYHLLMAAVSATHTTWQLLGSNVVPALSTDGTYGTAVRGYNTRMIASSVRVIIPYSYIALYHTECNISWWISNASADGKMINTATRLYNKKVDVAGSLFTGYDVLVDAELTNYWIPDNSNLWIDVEWAPTLQNVPARPSVEWRYMGVVTPIDRQLPA
jgi:hypothetical protein